MLRYYGRVFNAAPHVFREAWERVALVIDLIIAALVFFNQQLAEAVAKQRGFSPWWVLLPVGLLFVYGIAKANYEQFQTIASQLEHVREQITNLPDVSLSRLIFEPEHRFPVVHFGRHGYAPPPADLYQVEIINSGGHSDDVAVQVEFEPPLPGIGLRYLPCTRGTSYIEAFSMPRGSREVLNLLSIGPVNEIDTQYRLYNTHAQFGSESVPLDRQYVIHLRIVAGSAPPKDYRLAVDARDGKLNIVLAP